MISDVLAVGPELCLLAGAVGGLLLGLWLPRERQGYAHLVASAGLVAAAGTTVPGFGAPAMSAYDGTYTVDTALRVVRVVVPLAGLAVLALSRDRVRGHPRETEFATLVVLAVLGTVLLAGASDLLVLVAAYAVASVPLYTLAGFGKDAPGAEAALKLALYGAFLGIVMLAGVTSLYGLAGATGYDALRGGLAGAPAAAVVAGAVALLAGLLFKAGAVPAHFWVPDAVQGSWTGVAAFLTTVPKIGAVVAVQRLVVDVLPADGTTPLLLAVLAAASMTLGNLAAFWQDDVRRLLAYSTVGQIGYLFIVPAAAGVDLAMPALLFYLGAYAVTNIGAFAVVVACPGATRLADYRGLSGRDPLLAFTLVVCLLGFVGTPPTAVFVGKLAVFTAGIDAGMVWLVVLAAANTVASVFYYLRWIVPLFRERATAPAARAEAGWARAVAYGSGALTLLGGLAAGVALDVLRW
ncbi:NADH-quinone oxidoreductase subunit N [Actinophytocola glycyrrhizae]|uniref:NADH-quinone oxidoreductase subunit N n=1 Tax=Actinophytocola glycyrrhizae TaxID=2044873 RepID=A0ABV9SG26_9PSEU